MGERLYRDVFGAEMVLTDSVRANILVKHPEAVDLIDLIDQVLSDPVEVRRSVRDVRSMLYYRLYYRFEPTVLMG